MHKRPTPWDGFKAEKAIYVAESRYLAFRGVAVAARVLRGLEKGHAASALIEAARVVLDTALESAKVKR